MRGKTEIKDLLVGKIYLLKWEVSKTFDLFSVAEIKEPVVNDITMKINNDFISVKSVKESKFRAVFYDISPAERYIFAKIKYKAEVFDFIENCVKKEELKESKQSSSEVDEGNINFDELLEMALGKHDIEWCKVIAKRKKAFAERKSMQS